MIVSNEQILALIVFLSGLIGTMFKLLQSSQSREFTTLKESCEARIEEKDETITWLKAELRTSLRTTERATTAAETATHVAKKASEG